MTEQPRVKMEMWILNLTFDQLNPPQTGQTDYLFMYKFEPTADVLSRNVTCKYDLTRTGKIVASIEAKFSITIDKIPNLGIKHPELLIMAKIALQYTQRELINALALKGVKISLSFPSDDNILQGVSAAVKSAGLQ